MQTGTSSVCHLEPPHGSTARWGAPAAAGGAWGAAGDGEEGSRGLPWLQSPRRPHSRLLRARLWVNPAPSGAGPRPRRCRLRGERARPGPAPWRRPPVAAPNGTLSRSYGARAAPGVRGGRVGALRGRGGGGRRGGGRGGRLREAGRSGKRERAGVWGLGLFGVVWGPGASRPCWAGAGRCLARSSPLRLAPQRGGAALLLLALVFRVGPPQAVCWRSVPQGGSVREQVPRSKFWTFQACPRRLLHLEAPADPCEVLTQLLSKAEEQSSRSSFGTQTPHLFSLGYPAL